MTITKAFLVLLSILTFLTDLVYAQGMKMSEVIIVSNSPLKKAVDTAEFKSYIVNDLAPFWKKNMKGSIHLFRADRGNRKGEFLLVCESNKNDRKKLGEGSPFTDKALSKQNALSKRSSDFLVRPEAYTEYQLIGAEKFQSLPVNGILGIHYIKVKPDRAAEFEKFVADKLHPAVGQLLNDMQLLYYKAVAGENTGTYITIFAIESVAARDKYWPEGAPETEILKQAFRPLENLARELAPYLVEGSYLLPESGGAAAYFESREWTDFVRY